MKKMTIAEVASAAGVSKATISRFLNGNYGKMSADTQERIRQTIQRLNYRPNKQAQMLKTNRSGLIGFIVADMGNLYSSKLLSGASAVARENDYQLVIMESNNSLVSEEDALKKFVDQSVEGILIQPISEDSSRYESVGKRCPMVLVDRQTTPKTWPAVIVDNALSTKYLAEYIVKKGYSKIAIFSESLTTDVRRKRYAGMREVAKEHSLESELVEVGNLQLTNTYSDMKKRVSELVSEDEKIAIFASNSQTLLMVLRILDDLRIKIPDEVGVSGYDDWNWAFLAQPAITSIEQNASDVGAEAMRMLLADIDPLRESVKETKVIPSKINIRESI
ncbi:LacI family DNA-binding transcriptional regulator [Levilactobacillus andaensis]|uniref:LacI family DNA-binding transcriptional regulator n=1 Tax=Levilactobacillus andaensis TaxID=2799570 RepID=UPI0019408420|nr:LacI family DNA-binding transcriptional regulator [Levilactobacillus andaensis]